MDNDDKIRYAQTWWSRDLAKYLDIGESTLRKWCLELEKAGYKFLRDEHNRRTYVERDALALRKMKDLLAEGQSYDIASSTVVSQHLNVNSINQIAGSANPKKSVNEAIEMRYLAIPEEVEQLRSDIHELAELGRQQADQVAQLIEMNQTLYARLDEQQKYIEKAINIRDQQLIAALRDMREQRLQLAAAAEMERKKPLWKRLFGGK